MKQRPSRRTDRGNPAHERARFHFRLGISMVASFLLQVSLFVFYYGRLVERVDSLQYEVRELRQLFIQTTLQSRH